MAPPEADTVADPVESPLQEISVLSLINTVGPPKLLIPTEAESVQPFVSVTTIAYVPSERPVAVVSVCAGEVFHEYVYGSIPPLTDTVADPSLKPQLAAVVLVIRDNAVGWVKDVVIVVEQELLSVTVTV